MALESANFIDGLVITNPASGDPVAQGDDHLRLIKDVLKASFPTVTKATYLHIGQADVVSAATTDIGAVASDHVRITGTTTITALGTVAAGVHKVVRFAASLTLTNNAAIILPGGANIQTAADDFMECYSLGAGNWVVTQYTKASGEAIAGTLKLTARAATTANITIGDDLNNLDVLDGVTLATGDLVLVKDQTAPAENGVYVVGGTPARAPRYDTYDEHPGAFLTVQEGTANADTLWLCTSNVGGTIDVTAIAFAQRGAIPLPVSEGGTNAITAAAAFTNLKQAATDSATGVIEIADQTEMEAASSALVAVTPGRQKHHVGHAKAWVNYNQTTPAIVDDWEVTSVSDDGTGKFTVTLTTAFSNTNYIAVGMAYDVGGGSERILSGTNTAYTTTTRSFNVGNVSGAEADEGSYIAFFGDQA